MLSFGYVGSVTKGTKKKHPVEAMLEAIKSEANKRDAPKEVPYRIALADVILPKILDVKTKQVDFEESKRWAFSCGTMIGLLCGLTIKKESMSGAIDNVARLAKETAKRTHELLEKAFGQAEGEEEKARPEGTGGVKVPVNTQHEHMVEELERQAKGEKDPAAAAALRLMAERMRGKTEKEAA